MQGIHLGGGSTATPLDDPDFVEWYAIFELFDKEVSTYSTVDVHKCTEEDYSEFNEISED